MFQRKDRKVKMGYKLFNRDFTIMIVGQIMSLFGNAVMRFALSLYVLDQTGSSSVFGMILAISMIPMVVGAPFGGILADRVSRKWIMVALDYITALTIGIFGILIQHKEGENYWYDAAAVTDCKVLAIPWKFLFRICPKSCDYHGTLIKNMISVQADSCVSQMKKLHILSGTTVEAKAAYLMFELADENGELDFKMNREELADFLGVTRPSLSRSLMKLQTEGYIKIHKSKAKILDYEGLERVCHK